MLGVIEGAVKIADLWKPSKEAIEEDFEEAYAVYLMLSKLEAILKKASAQKSASS